MDGGFHSSDNFKAQRWEWKLPYVTFETNWISARLSIVQQWILPHHGRHADQGNKISGHILKRLWEHVHFFLNRFRVYSHFGFFLFSSRRCALTSFTVTSVRSQPSVLGSGLLDWGSLIISMFCQPETNTRAPKWQQLTMVVTKRIYQKNPFHPTFISMTVCRALVLAGSTWGWVRRWSSWGGTR